jgi:hypothetical protein
MQKLFGMKRGRVRYWDKIGFLTPSVKIGRRKYYTSQDLIGLRTAKGLLDAGLSFAKVRCTVIDVKKISSPIWKFPPQLLIHGDRKGVFLDGGTVLPNPRGGLLVGFTQRDFGRGMKSATIQIELESKTQLKGRGATRGTPTAIRPSTKPKDP